MPLDDNLPIFHLTPQAREPHITTLTFTANGSPPTAAYTKTRAPDIDATYSTTLHDAFVPDILYATVIATPEIVQQPASSPGAPPPPAKVLLPKEFPLQLYNPDSTVIVTHNHSTLRGSFWEFSLPKTSFLPPTASRLDAASAAHQNALSHLPRATFRWRKEGGVLSKSMLRCSLVSPANLGSGPKKAGANEPDILIATFEGLGDKKGMGDITIYQSNLKRVEVEDFKGLEVVLVLSAMAIGDMWFCPTNLVFNLTPTSASPVTAAAVAGVNGGRRRTSSTPNIPPTVNPSPTMQSHPPTNLHSHRTSYPQHTQPPPSSPHHHHHQDIKSPTTTQRDYQAHKAEEAARRAAQLKKEEEATLRMLAEEEARERQRREMEVERETQRLRVVYERERSAVMQQQQQRPPVVGGGGGGMGWGGRRPPVVGGGSWGNGGGGGGGLRPIQEGKKVSSRKSFLGLRFGGSGSGDAAANNGGGGGGGAKTKPKKLSKKGSSMF
ncbi:hypothetical protein L873DRAFT_1195442 [Choiromyces venosus 120613-1]|uniref:Uncharacterized protein n=1 Tax=Choiromyces venosus 120613-1 TaxID=1336337 RepID=A0A3N4JHQ1_9PEZI|nr:hypothetical protein L873DRAFT_1195442 [Choiromyces venosus 120613-1]